MALQCDDNNILGIPKCFWGESNSTITITRTQTIIWKHYGTWTLLKEKLVSLLAIIIWTGGSLLSIQFRLYWIFSSTKIYKCDCGVGRTCCFYHLFSICNKSSQLSNNLLFLHEHTLNCKLNHNYMFIYLIFWEVLVWIGM